MLPSNLINIWFNWIFIDQNDLIKQHIEMVNNIPSYYHVIILLKKNKYNPKWPIHVVEYRENEWPSDIYEIKDKYRHPIHGDITILINKNTYQPYSSAKSALT